MPNGRGNLGLSDVTVEKAWLIGILKANRETHHAAFLQACDVFQKEAERRLRKLLEEVRAGRLPDYLGVRLPIPEEHIEDYDRAVGMLENSINDTVTLSEHAYAQLVEDNWGWASSFTSSTLVYAGDSYKSL